MSDQPMAGPITADERVSDVLARDEALVSVFARHASHFEKLRNRALRRVMARLVTVRQAAQMAGVSADALVADLNAALGVTVPVSGAGGVAGHTDEWGAGAGGGHRRPLAAPEVALDVRDLLRDGGEPFSKIMAAVASLPDGAVLRLRAIFEPVPLYVVLGKRGFAHEARAGAPDDWTVWFWRSAPTGGSVDDAVSPPAAAAERDSTDPSTTWLDVRHLQPPEPLLRTLAALEALPEGHTLVQVNVRVPQFLLPVLAERGYACEIDESQADRVLVRIWRP